MWTPLGGGPGPPLGPQKYIKKRPEIFKKAYGNLNTAILHSTTYNGFGEECATAIEAINITLKENYIGHYKTAIQEGLELLGYLIIFYGAILMSKISLNDTKIKED